MAQFEKIKVPQGEKIKIAGGKVSVPNNPIVPFIEGDGNGRRYLGKLPYGLSMPQSKKPMAEKRKLPGVKSTPATKPLKSTMENYFPKETLDAVKEFVVAIKGPLSTPVGGGHALSQRRHEKRS